MTKVFVFFSDKIAVMLLLSRPTSSLLSLFPAAAEPESERAVVFPAGSVLCHRVVRMQRTRGLCASQNADEHVLYILPRG